MQPKAGGKLHLRLNTGERPIANKYREGKLKSTLKRESKGREIANRETMDVSTRRRVSQMWCVVPSLIAESVKAPRIELWRDAQHCIFAFGGSTSVPFARLKRTRQCTLHGNMGGLIRLRRGNVSWD